MPPDASGVASPAEHLAAREARHERVARMAQEVVGGRDLAQPPVDDHADAVGERGRVAEVVGHDDPSGARSWASRSWRWARTLARVCVVERRKRLVEQQDAGVPRERAGERGALALTTRDPARASRPRGGRSRGARAARRRRSPAPHRRRRSCAHRHVREQRVLLEDEADGPAPRARRSTRASASNHRSPPEGDPGRGPAAAGPRSRAGRCLLPAPDGPTRATVSCANGQADPRARTTEERRRCRARASPRRQQFVGQQDGRAQNHEQDADRERDVEVRVELLVDAEREGLRLAAHVAGEDDRRPELPDAAGEREHPPGEQPPAASGSEMRTNVRAGEEPSVRAAST